MEWECVLVPIGAAVFVFLVLPWAIAGLSLYWDWCAEKIYGEDDDD